MKKDKNEKRNIFSGIIIVVILAAIIVLTIYQDQIVNMLGEIVTKIIRISLAIIVLALFIRLVIRLFKYVKSINEKKK